MRSILKTNFLKCFWSLSLLTLAIAVASCQSQNQETTTNPPTATPSPAESPVTESPASPVASSSETMLIDDLENNKGINKQGGGWYSYDDKGSGGDSQVSPFKPVSGGANNSKYSALLKGNITPKSGYIGMGMDFTADGKPIDLTQYKGIKFCAKGDNGKYYFKFHSQAIPDYNDYVHVFTATPQWECQQVLFTDMKQFDPNKPVDLQKALAEAVSIQFQTADQPPKSVELAVDDVEFWK